jgi:hypothetical protein
MVAFCRSHPLDEERHDLSPVGAEEHALLIDPDDAGGLGLVPRAPRLHVELVVHRAVRQREHLRGQEGELDRTEEKARGAEKGDTGEGKEQVRHHILAAVKEKVR